MTEALTEVLDLPQKLLSEKGRGVFADPFFAQFLRTT